eukprot:2677333-Lingulodinium_polyedra.AAC.1
MRPKPPPPALPWTERSIGAGAASGTSVPEGGRCTAAPGLEADSVPPTHGPGCGHSSGAVDASR